MEKIPFADFWKQIENRQSAEAERFFEKRLQDIKEALKKDNVAILLNERDIQRITAMSAISPELRQRVLTEFPGFLVGTHNIDAFEEVCRAAIRAVSESISN